MRYYFHILTDRERLRDPDGEEFSTLMEACEEATQSARDIIAEHLRCVRAVPSLWSVQIAQEDDTVLQTVSFTPLLIHHDIHQPLLPRMPNSDVIARPRATHLRARATTAEITRLLIEVRENLDVLGQLNEESKKHERH